MIQVKLHEAVYHPVRMVSIKYSSRQDLAGESQICDIIRNHENDVTVVRVISAWFLQGRCRPTSFVVTKYYNTATLTAMERLRTVSDTATTDKVSPPFIHII